MKGRQKGLEEICKQFGVASLYVFGSQSHLILDWVEGQENSLNIGSSDIDIGVTIAGGMTLIISEKIHLTIALENFFGCNRVDVVFLNEADPFLAAEVIRGERLFVQDEYKADEYELYILRRAGDLSPIERERMALVLGEYA